MQFRLFCCPASGEEVPLEELNAFLRSHRVLSVERELVSAGSSPSWCFCVEYLDGPSTTGRPQATERERKDYRKILPEEAFARFARYRECRKELAAEDSIPPYFIFTDEQLAEMARAPAFSRSVMGGVKGVGKGKLEKYGERFERLVARKQEESAEPAAEADGNASHADVPSAVAETKETEP